jgi:XTP/dITP diphosphohydrolase
MDLLLATRNAHKRREFREVLGPGFDVIDLSSFPEIAIPKETGRTFEENATLKAIAASRKLPSLVIADDSGLEVDALGGAPGVFSARYAGENPGDVSNVDKLLRELRKQNIATEKRSARFRCVIALAQNGKLLGVFEGFVEGKIVDPPRGSGGFGYDPIFEPKGFDQTFAEMRAESKNQISHRGQAIAALRKALREIEN